MSFIPNESTVGRPSKRVRGMKKELSAPRIPKNTTRIQGIEWWIADGETIGKLFARYYKEEIDVPFLKWAQNKKLMGLMGAKK